MPDRVIRTGILTSDSVNALTFGAEVFYRRLMSVVDDYGRYDGRVAVLRASLYALKLNDVSEDYIGDWICECTRAGLIAAYEIDGRKFLQISKFNQRIQGKPRWPEPPAGPIKNHGILVNSPRSTVEHGEPPEKTASRVARAFGDGDGDVFGDVGRNDAADGPPPASKAKKKPPELTDAAYIAELSSDPTYRGINIANEAGKMTRWCEAHGKRPTRRRLVNWINRVDRPLSLKGDEPTKPKRCV